MARGKRSSAVSTSGAKTALGAVLSPRYWTNWMTATRSTMTSGASMAPSFALAGLLRGRKKKPGVPNRLGGRAQAQIKEPPDHALGRSRGGFGTKVHLVCDRKGFVLALWVTGGQVHESKVFETTMAQRLLPNRRGRMRWPHRLAGDKGYSYPRIRKWCSKRIIQAVIPTRSNQPQEARFDKAAYRQRNMIERVIGRYKDYRSLATRYEKLAVNYIALWLVAIMEQALKRLLPNRP